MSGNDRRTALLGSLEKIRKLIASFFRAFAQDEVHWLVSETTVQHRTDLVNSIRPPAPLGPSLDSSAPMAFSGCELDRENDDEGRHHGGKQTGTISMIGRESETWTSLHRQDRWNQFFPVASIVKIGRS